MRSLWVCGGEVVDGGFEVVAGGDAVDEVPASGVDGGEPLAGEQDFPCRGEADEVDKGLDAGVAVAEAESGGGAAELRVVEGDAEVGAERGEQSESDCLKWLHLRLA